MVVTELSIVCKETIEIVREIERVCVGGGGGGGWEERERDSDLNPIEIISVI